MPHSQAFDKTQANASIVTKKCRTRTRAQRTRDKALQNEEKVLDLYHVFWSLSYEAQQHINFNHLPVPEYGDINLYNRSISQRILTIGALDVGINKPLKSFFREAFENYCASSISTQLKQGTPAANIKVNLKLSALRKNDEDLVQNAWVGVEHNLVKVLGDKVSLPPVSVSPRRYVTEFLKHQ